MDLLQSTIDPCGLVFGIYTFTFILHRVLPGTTTLGYVCSNDGQRLSYKLNGFLVTFVMTFLFLCLPLPTQLTLHSHFGTVVAFANGSGLLFSTYFYLTSFGPEPYARCLTLDQVDPVTKRPREGLALSSGSPAALTEFFLGRNWNPRFQNLDVKMFLYLVGATFLQCNLLSCVAYQHAEKGSLSVAMKVYLFCFEWFLAEYLFFENVHLYTYDLFAEKVGFKLVWGCLVFYPCFYCIGIFEIVQAPATVDMPYALASLSVALFYLGWVMTRGANLQKYYFRTAPTRRTCFLGLITQRVVPGTRLLVSGFWGVSRHLNYLGEIVQAVALAVPGVYVGFMGGSKLFFLPILYPLYYIILFVPREMDDDKVCERKYGEDWKRYKKEVPYRIIPGVW